MLIQKSSIRNPDNYLGFVKKGSNVIIGAKGLERFEKKLQQIKFTKNLSSGETILPAGDLGPKSSFNANGKYIVHKDQEKEYRYVRTVWWEWEQWAGYGETEHHEDWKDVYAECYPRTFIEPPSIQLSIIKLTDGQKAVVSSPVKWTDKNKDTVAHAINLFLEIFGEAEIFSEDLKSFMPPSFVRLNWEILPPGKMPWELLHKYMVPIIDKAEEGNKRFIKERLETLNVYGPDFTAVGRCGFEGYVIFGFENKNMYVVESGYYGNATYVFGKDWEYLSQLTKKEILDANLQEDRIIHRRQWFEDIKKLLAKQ